MTKTRLKQYEKLYKENLAKAKAVKYKLKLLKNMLTKREKAKLEKKLGLYEENAKRYRERFLYYKRVLNTRKRRGSKRAARKRK